MADLSQDARQLAGSFFGFHAPGMSTIRVRRPHAITERARAALDELIAAGFVSETPDPIYRGSVVFAAVRSCQDFAIELVKKYGLGGAFPNPIQICHPEDKPHG